METETEVTGKKHPSNNIQFLSDDANDMIEYSFGALIIRALNVHCVCSAVSIYML